MNGNKVGFKEKYGSGKTIASMNYRLGSYF